METSDTQWQVWVKEHTPKLLLFARQKTRCEADAEDLVQEAVLETSRRSGGAPPELASVFGNIRLRAIDLARRHERRAHREQAIAEDTAVAWFDGSAEERETKGLLEQALRRLPEAYREVVTLKIWGGLTFVQIGEALQTSPNTIASRYRYALEELRKITRGVLV